MVVKSTKVYSEYQEPTIRSTKSKSPNPGPVHQRLYARSKIRQNEGKELREQIETARKAKLFAPVKRIQPKEAEHLYGRLYSDYFKKQKELEALAVQAAEKESKQLAVKKSTIMSEKAAKELFNRLYEEKTTCQSKTTSQSSSVCCDTLETDTRRSAGTMSEKVAQRLYERLHQEKTSSLLAPPVEEKKIRKAMFRISENAAQELYRRLATEKTLSMIVDKPVPDKKFSVISKKSANQLFSRLSTEKTLAMKAKDLGSSPCNDIASGISKSNSSRASKCSTTSASEVHHRLYARSQSRQNEGREKREQIKLKKEYIQKPTLKMSEKSARKLFDRLYTESTRSVAAKYENDDASSNCPAKPRIIKSEKAAEQIFDRLHNHPKSRLRKRAAE